MPSIIILQGVMVLVVNSAVLPENRNDYLLRRYMMMNTDPYEFFKQRADFFMQTFDALNQMSFSKK